ncbi:helix-turn-helix transcriptional regulator [Lactococcus cremoris]|uniref:helix-turn-helix domain-containing protein n=1 Tax=Lactococcus lactis subsp. cremoris TaxID=1359 RepID=UPI0011098587|nr:helix-turn-helix transcriptional regulator [Lactococcus cremoris]TLQ10957.1 helix-turn-helix transcriptional regulator [Lactococcus cremoris]
MAEDSLKDFQILGDNELMEIKGGDLSTNIRNERLAIGLTQNQLAEQLQFSKQAVYNWEKGKCEPNIETLEALATLFNISVDKLIR